MLLSNISNAIIKSLVSLSFILTLSYYIFSSPQEIVDILVDPATVHILNFLQRDSTRRYR